jgi:hypothetical protein
MKKGEKLPKFTTKDTKEGHEGHKGNFVVQSCSLEVTHQ